MKLISHRGNLNGVDAQTENTIDQIKKVCGLGFDCEIDVWYNNGYFLGHDAPIHPIDEAFLENPQLWCHAKNIAALQRMLLNDKIHSFWHQNDDCSITSKKFIWSFPNSNPDNRTIFLDFSSSWTKKNYACVGICSDYIII